MTVLVGLAAVLAWGRAAETVPVNRTVAAPARIVDSGRFTHYLREARIGEERFVISEESTGGGGTLLQASADLNRKIGGETGRVRVALEALGPYPRPRRYEADINGSAATTLVAVLVRDRLRLDVRSPAGQEMRQFLIQDNVLILDPFLAHQYFFAARMLGEGDSIRAKLIVPQERSESLVWVRDLGLDELAVQGERRSLRHLRIEGEGLATRDAWVDGERVVVVEIRSEKWRAIRADVLGDVATEKGPLR